MIGGFNDIVHFHSIIRDSNRVSLEYVSSLLFC